MEGNMKTLQLLENPEFNDSHPVAKSIIADEYARVLLFTLKPGQEIKQHSNQASPVYVTVLKGKGHFITSDGNTEIAGPGSMIIFDAAEEHSVKAADGELIFTALLHGSPRSHSHTD